MRLCFARLVETAATARPRLARPAAARGRRIAAIVAVVLAQPVLAAPPDNLNPHKSRHTVIDLKACKPIERHRDGAAWLCSGFNGLPVYIAEGDVRFFLSFGAAPRARRAASQTLAAFNTVFEGGRSRVTVEWRTSTREGRERPYAAIVRYFTSNETSKGQVLVVTRITDTEACHVGYIDALANDEPVALARSVADELAKTFDCRDEPRIVGVRGKSPL